MNNYIKILTFTFLVLFWSINIKLSAQVEVNNEPLSKEIKIEILTHEEAIKLDEAVNNYLQDKETEENLDLILKEWISLDHLDWLIEFSKKEKIEEEKIEEENRLIQKKIDEENRLKLEEEIINWTENQDLNISTPPVIKTNEMVIDEGKPVTSDRISTIENSKKRVEIQENKDDNNELKMLIYIQFWMFLVLIFIIFYILHKRK